eukprot:TRINITY_DN1184_c0_g1_i1.p2 TRINITY_DN1184_c0_g1~~TRINITY_DN1184_c0_g1_i1.p2  ORF type:complete len:321 (-),score=83.87 TRINITY_DN1184_c0_g1_i1:69-953(-)
MAASRTKGTRRRSAALSASVGLCTVLCCTRLLRGGPAEESNAFAVTKTATLDNHYDVSHAKSFAGIKAMPLRGQPMAPEPAKVSRGIGQTLNAIPETRFFREWIQHVMRFIGRQEERWLGPVNFDRQGLRLGAQDTYATLATIILGTVLGLYGCVPDVDENSTPLQKKLHTAQMALLAAATLTSTFTMVIFVLSKVYSVTALAFWKDVAYNTFTHATDTLRMQAFWSLIASNGFFMMAFCLNIAHRMGKGKNGYYVTAAAVAISLFCTYQFWVMTDMANKYIFQGFPRTYVNWA